MHVAHVIRDLDSASGGPSRSLPALGRALSRVDEDTRVTVIFQDRGNDLGLDVSQEQQVNFEALHGGFFGPRRILQRLLSVQSQTPIDVVHCHGLWSPSVHAASNFARANGIPYVVTPRGMLSAWCLNHKSLRKRVAWWAYQDKDLRSATCLHATSEAEADDVRDSGLEVPIAVIPNGCQTPGGEAFVDEAGVNERTRLAVCIARLHPVKGLGDAVDAWARVRPKGWKLMIAGPDPVGYSGRLRQRIDDHQLGSVVQVAGPVDGAEKWALLARAELFILGSQSENFGMSIAEALSSGTPVITTRGTPWQELVDHRCGWWVPVGSDALSAAITEATAKGSAELSEMGRRGCELIQSQYSWPVIARRMFELYCWMLDPSSERPTDLR